MPKKKSVPKRKTTTKKRVAGKKISKVKKKTLAQLIDEFDWRKLKKVSVGEAEIGKPRRA